MSSTDKDEPTVRIGAFTTPVYPWQALLPVLLHTGSSESNKNRTTTTQTSRECSQLLGAKKDQPHNTVPCWTAMAPSFNMNFMKNPESTCSANESEEISDEMDEALSSPIKVIFR